MEVEEPLTDADLKKVVESSELVLHLQEIKEKVGLFLLNNS